jgi:GntR family transcriptional regulator
MQLEIDFQSGEPIYAQICEQVKGHIASGLIQPGDQLPPSRKLANQVGVNFNTVARAYRELDREGIVSAQHGRGVFALPSPSPDVAGQRRREALEGLIQRFLEQAARLAFSPEEVVQIVQQEIQGWKAEG